MILGELLSFPSIRGKDWRSKFAEEDNVKVGDLVALRSCSPTKWYLSWLRKYDPNNGWPKYLLESIDDGSLCWWENVGVDFYNRDRVKDNPQWQWNDDKFAFYDRWNKVCRKNDAHIVLPCMPVFADDGSVLLNVRIRYGLSDYQNPRTYQNWKKVTMKEMDIYYKECVIGFDEESKGRELKRRTEL